ncbi:hypothetical protein KJ633_00055 [bacterium]|nr:hypothetical protein [bacterium]MBU3954833.1 hypothetical protein [bacterium]
MTKFFFTLFRSSFALILFLLLSSFSAAEQLPDLFPYNAYDGYNPSVRSLAMGGAGLCSTRDASAVYFNPAGLFGGDNMSLISLKVRQTPKELSGQYDILSGRSLTFLGFRGGGMAIAWQPLSNMISIGTAGSSVEVKVNKFTMSFSNNVSGAVNFGMNINYFSGYMGVTDGAAAKISDANGYGIDWGLTYRAHPNITFATSLFNSPSSISWGGYDADKPPVIARTGARVKLSHLLTVSAESENRKYSRAREADGKKTVKIFHAGLEQSLADIIYLRGGIFGEDLSDNNKTGYSAGIGWYQDKVNVDISWQKEYPLLSYDEYLETFSFSVNSPF